MILIIRPVATKLGAHRQIFWRRTPSGLSELGEEDELVCLGYDLPGPERFYRFFVLCLRVF